MNDLISRQAAIDAAMKDECILNAMDSVKDGEMHRTKRAITRIIAGLPSAQPEVAKRIVGMSRDCMTFWYQCDICNEPVDKQDVYCRGCGRRLIDE